MGETPTHLDVGEVAGYPGIGGVKALVVSECLGQNGNCFSETRGCVVGPAETVQRAGKALDVARIQRRSGQDAGELGGFLEIGDGAGNITGGVRALSPINQEPSVLSG
ncbi:hypothetical protein GCM10022236_01210 [Microlunatus ginsengisoli]|uniref:Uncharacterized protein n=1 Tax=Microlunatus ginsengisoli TaxID=363863 RepID=A0ABP6ZC79_9ACTN